MNAYTLYSDELIATNAQASNFQLYFAQLVMYWAKRTPRRHNDRLSVRTLVLPCTVRLSAFNFTLHKCYKQPAPEEQLSEAIQLATRFQLPTGFKLPTSVRTISKSLEIAKITDAH